MTTLYDDKQALIHSLRVKGKRYYRDLTQAEQRAAMSCFICEQTLSDKAGFLAVSDRDVVLPDMIANVIKTNGSLTSTILLIKTLLDICVYGKHVLLESEIDDALEHERLDEKSPYVDDMRRQDAAERASDMRKAC